MVEQSQPMKSKFAPAMAVLFLMFVPGAGCRQQSETRILETPSLSPTPPREKPLPENASPQLKLLVESAFEQTRVTTGYDPSYVALDYPGGDVPIQTGVCSDVIVRGFRKAGVDLQQEIHDDMKGAWTSYPRNWGASRPDTNIDHRRVPNLMNYFGRKGKSLPITSNSDDYLPGDIVSWDLGNNVPHIGVVAGETKSAGRNIGRSVVIASPIIAVMFILGTSSVLAFVPPDKVDLIGPIPQVLSLGFGSFGWVGRIISIAILGVVVRQLALMSIYFAGNTRLPMVAGWDRLLPEWFSRLHHKHKTPVNSILFVGAVTIAFGLTSLIGVGEQEAFQLLDNAAGVFYASTYMVLFAIPLIGMKKFGVTAPWWLKIACVSGFLVSLFYIGFTVVPIIAVQSRLLFALKIVAVVVIANSIGIAIFLGRNRQLEEIESKKSGVAG